MLETCIYQGITRLLNLISPYNSKDMMTTNLEASGPEPEHEPDAEPSQGFIFDHAALFWVTGAVSVVLMLVAIVGNAMVFVIGGRRMKTGAFRHLYYAIRSLAITDLLLGAVGMPLIILYSYWG